MRSLKLSLAILFVFISACSSLGSNNDENLASAGETDDDAEADANSEDIQALGALAATELPDRSCGMILWTLDAQRPSPVFRYVAGKKAEVVVGNRPVELVRVAGSGVSGFGVYESQEFESEDGLRVEVTNQFGVGFDGGAYLERGLVKVHSPEGWSVVAPAAGIAGCRS